MKENVPDDSSLLRQEAQKTSFTAQDILDEQFPEDRETGLGAFAERISEGFRVSGSAGFRRIYRHDERAEFERRFVRGKPQPVSAPVPHQAAQQTGTADEQAHEQIHEQAQKSVQKQRQVQEPAIVPTHQGLFTRATQALFGGMGELLAGSVAPSEIPLPAQQPAPSAGLSLADRLQASREKRAIEHMLSLEERLDACRGQFDAIRANPVFSAALKKQPGLDSEGRLVDSAIAAALADSVRGQTGTILEVTRETKKKTPPLPHCLSSLQKAASAKFGMTAQAVLDKAQSLYEKKLTTYPRSDCRYLPFEQCSDAGRILSALCGVPGLEQAASKANPALKGGVWDTSRVKTHHAIIPASEIPGQLSAPEHNLYLMISTAYCLQFYPPLTWEARGRLILDPGWTGFAEDKESGDESGDQSLPGVTRGDAVTCTKMEPLKKKTSPPSKFSEGTLIEAMSNVHRFVTDVHTKATLKENEGIGTEATRAGTIETLKSRGYIRADKKTLAATQLGQEIIDLTPESLRDPVTTAHWESRLEGIASGKETLAAFMEQLKASCSMRVRPPKRCWNCWKSNVPPVLASLPCV